MIRKEKKHRPASQVKVAAAATETVTVVAAVPMKGLASELIRLTINRRSFIFGRLRRELYAGAVKPANI